MSDPETVVCWGDGRQQRSMSMHSLVAWQGITLLRHLRPGPSGPTCPNGGSATDYKVVLKFMKIFFYYFSPYKYSFFVLEVKEINFQDQWLCWKL